MNAANHRKNETASGLYFFFLCIKVNITSNKLGAPNLSAASRASEGKQLSGTTQHWIQFCLIFYLLKKSWEGLRGFACK